MDDQNLIEWARTQGATIDGVKSEERPGRGRGIVSERNIKDGETLIHIPVKCLLTAGSTQGLPLELLEHLDQCSIHGQLAGRLAYMLLSGYDAVQPWMRVMPSMRDVHTSMPLFWPTVLQEHLPEAATKLLVGQRKKHDRDLDVASKIFLPAIEERWNRTEDRAQGYFSYAWCLVNSRCFYWDIPLQGQKHSRGVPSDRDDCMAMCPVIDCFNHSDSPDCHVTFNKNGFSVLSSRKIEAGKEIFFSYGQHSNDFLLVEYGFIMNTNSADHAIIDSTLLGRLSGPQKESLEAVNLLGKYSIDSEDGVCYRTQAALRIMHLTRRQWERFVDGFDDGDKEQKHTDQLCDEVLSDCATEARRHIKQLEEFNMEELGVVNICNRDILARRWRQIELTLEANIHEL